MAWMTKNSAGEKIERRDQPYLDDALKDELTKNVLPRYPSKRAALLPALHAIQDKYNWLPAQALEETAAFLNIRASEVLDTASFYEMFWMRPKGKYLVTVCQSLSCEMLGEEQLLATIQAKLGIEVGQTTDDGKFTLAHTECLGACEAAPCALINDQLHMNLKPEQVDQLLESLP